jgi:hypothetical protein
MSETKEEIAAERDALREEVKRVTAERDRLTGEVAAAGANRVAVPAHTFQLSQGQLADLETFGVTTVGGRQVTADEVRGMLEGNQAGLEIQEASAPAAVPVIPDRGEPRYGVDFVYPSVAPGQIDPAVAGQPGISGPPADSK